jgi:hypothetical protein
MLYAQFLAQLLLIPQGTTLGQIFFITTLVFSWGYNCLLSSVENEQLQMKMLENGLHLNLKPPGKARGEVNLTRFMAYILEGFTCRRSEPRE